MPIDEQQFGAMANQIGTLTKGQDELKKDHKEDNQKLNKKMDRLAYLILTNMGGGIGALIYVKPDAAKDILLSVLQFLTPGV